MKTDCDSRVLGAIRWIDAVSRARVSLPLVVTASPPQADQLRFVRNFSGLTVITHASDLEALTAVVDLADLAPSDAVALGSLPLTGEVSDPSGQYLPRKFTLTLPRNSDPAINAATGQRPPNSLFDPIELELLPSPSAKVPAGWAQVRVLVTTADGEPIPRTLARVVPVAGGTPLGYGQTDARGEALVAIPNLQHFTASTTEDVVFTLTTDARLELIFPVAGENPVDWTAMKMAPVASPGHGDPDPLPLRPGQLFSRTFPFAT